MKVWASGASLVSNGAFGDGMGTGSASRRRCSSSSVEMTGTADGLVGVSCGEDPRGSGRNLGEEDVAGESTECNGDRGMRGERELKDADKGVETEGLYAEYACCTDGEILISALIANLSS